MVSDWNNAVNIQTFSQEPGCIAHLLENKHSEPLKVK